MARTPLSFGMAAYQKKRQMTFQKEMFSMGQNLL